MPRLRPLAAGIRAACIPAGLLFVLGTTTSLAGPEGGKVVGGEGNINKPDANTTNIQQQSHNMAIDWNSYNLNKNETVNYRQPSSTAHALNRIYDQNPSQIHGAINANGRVTLVNPNGIFFSPTASVNVGALTAAGHDVSVEDFMNGRMKFRAPEGQSAGAVINQGLLQAATGGSINLIGGSVRNEGLIIASAGQVNLVAGDQVTMDFDGDGLVRFAIDKEVIENAEGVDSAISNTGEISADGGTVILSGRAAQNVFSHVVNNEGVIRAGRIENQGGKIVLAGTGGSQSSVINTGTLDASAGDATSDGGTVEITGDTIEQQGVIKADSTGGDGGTIKLVAEDTNIISGDAVMSATSSPLPVGEGQGEGDEDDSSSPLPLGEGQGEGGKGGSVHVLGDKVALLDASTIDVSGELGGGEVLIGGDFQGKPVPERYQERLRIRTPAGPMSVATPPSRLMP
ncbi:MAG: filamentous hemagglutinin N-terminal domain-containing protein [Gammaproteobacteria bacterium]|nr:filamentous hemagglutinin N-terminal domain-containing protein [Gammaproteobacteria bacterium]